MMYNFKKKLFFVVLSTLLLILLLGLYGNCYADNYHTFTVSDIKNICYNKWITIDSNTDTGINNYFDNHVNDLNSLVSNLNSYNFVCVSFDGHSFNFLYTNNTSKPYIYSGTIQRWGTNTTGYRCVLDIRYDIFRFDNPSNNSISSSFNSNYYYVGNNVYTNSSATTVKYTGGSYSPSTFFDGDFTEDKWEFTPNGSTVTIDGSQWPYRYVDASYNLHLGSLVDAEHLHTIKVRFATYNQSLGSFAPYSDSNWQIIYDYDRDGRVVNRYPGAVTNNNGQITLDFSMDLHNQQNNLMQLSFVSDVPNQWPTLTQDYYIGNTYTYVSSGVVYPSLTFSGDYGNDYNQQNQDNIIQENHDETINTITDDSQVDDILNGYFSGDYNDMADQWGFNPFQNPYYDFLKSVLFGICDVLADQRDVTLNISFFGRTIILHSEDFTTPNNLITQFIKYVLIFFYIYNCFKFFYSVIISFETADIETIKQKIGTDEFYYKDGKYM